VTGGQLAALAALGAFHGLNPAMGWLFAVALGMQEGDRRAVLRALPPIALGHEAAIALGSSDRRTPRRLPSCMPPRHREQPAHGRVEAVVGAQRGHGQPRPGVAHG